MKIEMSESESADLTANELLEIQWGWVLEQREVLDRLRRALDRLTEAREAVRGTAETMVGTQLVDSIIELAADIKREEKDLIYLRGELNDMEKTANQKRARQYLAPPAPPPPPIPREREGFARRLES